jgi:hypothetical protein
MKKEWLVKTLALCIVVLFIGVSCSSAVSINNVNQITVEICNEKGVQKNIIALTDGEMQNLSLLVKDIKIQMNTAKSEEEKLSIYYNTMKEFSKYGLLGNLTVEEAYKLVIRWYKPSYSNYGKKQNGYLNNKNVFCLINGITNYTYTTHRFTNWLKAFGNIIIWKWTPNQFNIIWFILALGSFFLGFVLSSLADLNPVAILDVFGIGFYSGYDNKIYYAPGWVQTFGLLGYKKWDGELLGNLLGWTLPYDPFCLILTYPAVWGFSGIKIWLNKDGSAKSYIGSALAVGLDVK